MHRGTYMGSTPVGLDRQSSQNEINFGFINTIGWILFSLGITLHICNISVFF